MERAMKALVATDYGEPPAGLQIEQIANPSPGPGQLLVRIEAAGLNPFDLKQINGAMREIAPVSFPHQIGMDGAGLIAGVGEGVSEYSEGDSVAGFFGAHPGTVAEYAVIDVGPALSLRPDGVDAVHAAAMPESGMTALTLWRSAKLKRGESVLVIGATGGIGMFLVQFAASAGIEVIATASGEDADYVRDLGAAEVVDYRRADVVEEVLGMRTGGVDAVIDLIGMGEAILSSARAVREGGRLVSPLGGPEELGRGVSAVYIGSFTPQPGDLESLLDQAADGSLKLEVSRTYPLDNSPAAMADFAHGHTRGKIVIVV